MEKVNIPELKIKKPNIIKPSVLVLIFICFVIFLTFYIVPQQGGLITSTSLSSTDLQNADPGMQEQIPIQEVGMGAFGRSITLFNVILVSTGATFAVAGVLFFVSLYPTFATNLFHLYWWPLFFEAIFFAIEIAFLYTYWFTWDEISNLWHQFLGYGYAIAVMLQTFLINMVAGGMLTPGDEITWGSNGIMTLDWAKAMSWWLNDTVWRLQFHRMAAAISYIGFILAMLGIFHYISKKYKATRREWDWFASYGIAWGLFGLVLQPIFGLLYMIQIQGPQPNAFEMIMHESRAWEMLLMVSLHYACFSWFSLPGWEQTASMIRQPGRTRSEQRISNMQRCLFW